MSCTAVERQIAVVSPCNFMPVEQGRILPLTNTNTDTDWSSRDLGQPSTHTLESSAADQRTATITVVTPSNSQQLVRRGSSSSDEESVPSGTGLPPVGTIDKVKSGTKRVIGVVNPSSRRQVGESDGRSSESVRRTDCERTENFSELPYYHGSITSTEAKRQLRDQPVGTFLLRDSQSHNPQFPLAISVVIRTTSDRCQIQSIRVARCQINGSYYLDCPENQLRTMPHFPNVAYLMNYLTGSSQNPQEAAICLVSDKEANHKLPLLLTHPLLPLSS